MLFTLILLQVRHLSLGVLGAVGFNHPDHFRFTLSSCSEERVRVKAGPADPPHLPMSSLLPSPSHSRAPAVCTGLIRDAVFNAGWFGSFLEN